MLLLLIRHGNTFDPDQTPYYVGRTDLALSQSGSQQAAAIADAIDKAGILPACIYTSQLRRTQQTMLPTITRLEITKVKADARLNEIDYGKWEAKTNAEVDAMYDGSDKPRKAWDTRRERPADAGFKPSEADLKKNIEQLAEEIWTNFDDDKIVVICTSNGLMSEFLKLVPGAYERVQAAGAAKVNTGSFSAIDLYAEPSKRKLLFWNQKASEAPLEDY